MSEEGAEEQCSSECASSATGPTLPATTATSTATAATSAAVATSLSTAESTSAISTSSTATEPSSSTASPASARTSPSPPASPPASTASSSPPSLDSEMACGSWMWSYKALAATLLSLLFAILAFHPNIHRLLVRSENADDSLNFVRNFHFWSRRFPTEAQYLRVGSRGSLASVQFYPRKTYFIIHGFLGSGVDNWIIAMKDALLRREDCNVIAVTWSAGTLTAEYYVIKPRVSKVGEDVGRMVKFLIEAGGLPRSKVHVIGHSLGAHAAGFTGKELNGTLGRITGLDPAGHMFHGVDEEWRLHKTDAQFVDVIHTHGCYTPIGQWNDCFGIDENIGDADFWPNGGERQPSCLEGGDGPASVKDGSSCDHGMAYVLFTESIQYKPSTTYFLARHCSTWKYYVQGLCPCSSTAQYMGYNANPRTHGTFYLNTSITSPFARLDPECSAGAYSSLQLTGVVILAVMLVMALIVATLVVSQMYLGVPILAAMGLEGRSWLVRSSSRTEIAASSETYLVT